MLALLLSPHQRRTSVGSTGRCLLSYGGYLTLPKPSDLQNQDKIDWLSKAQSKGKSGAFRLSRGSRRCLCKSRHQFSFAIRGKSCLQRCPAGTATDPAGQSSASNASPGLLSLQELAKIQTEKRKLTPKQPS